MRIDQLVSQLLAPIPSAPLRRQGGVGAIGGFGTGLGSNRQGYGLNRPAAIPTGASSSGVSGTQNNADGDRADLLTLLASRLGASKGSTDPLAGSGSASGAGASAPQSQDAGGSILESFYRRKATIAYHFPQQNAFGPSIDYTFEVEVAYRQIDFIPAGSTVDTQG